MFSKFLVTLVLILSLHFVQRIADEPTWGLEYPLHPAQPNPSKFWFLIHRSLRGIAEV